LGTVVGSVVAVALAVALWLGFRLCKWFGTGETAFDPEDDLRLLREEWIFPVLGCAIFGACAGWVTFAPARRFSFALSLVIIFLVSIPLIVVVRSLVDTPPRYKGVAHPQIYPSEVLVLMGPPIVVAAILTLVRVRRVRRDNPHPVG
jgi:hypothetical protein